MAVIQKIDCDTSIGIQASTLKLDELEDITLPAPEKDGRIRTLNNMGCVTQGMYQVTRDFIDFAATCTLPVLDVGAAYGVSTIAALKTGAKVIANDIEEKHLNYIIKNKSLSQEDRTRLFLKPGALPNCIDFLPHSLGAIHVSRVMHFFQPEEIEEMFKKAAEWLAPQGRLYISSMSPYHHVAKGFGKVYTDRLLKGEKWPGNVNSFIHINNHLYALDPIILTRLAVKYEFLVKKLELFGQFDPNENDYIAAVLINNKSL